MFRWEDGGEFTVGVAGCVHDPQYPPSGDLGRAMQRLKLFYFVQAHFRDPRVGGTLRFGHSRTFPDGRILPAETTVQIAQAKLVDDWGEHGRKWELEVEAPKEPAA